MLRRMDLTRFVAAVSSPIGRIGGSFYFADATVERGNELGLQGRRFYFLGRGGVLGDVEPAVVASALGYFNVSLIEHLWNSARLAVPPRTAAREHLACAAAFGRSHFAGIDHLAEFCAAMEHVRDAVHPAGLALFAGFSAEPLVEDSAGRAMQLAVVLRELRGSAHLLAVISQLLDPKIAHYLRRPDAWEAFGYRDEAPPAVDDTHRARLAAADELTDRLVTPAWATLDDRQGEVVRTVLDAMVAALPAT
jgi:hypothetical protein